jgi:fructuronate reductase
VTELAATRGGDLAEWIAGTVAFPSSMVDRMVPATTDDVRTELRERFGYADEAAVATERFSQWVLEDTFTGGRPAWELAGVEVVADVAPFEQAKLRILNGAHSAFAYLGLLAGYAAMADAARDPSLRAAVVAMLDSEVIPTLRAPDGLDLTAYAARTVDRFSNRALGYLTAKVAADGSQKLPVRILGTVRDRMAAGAGIEGLAAVVAAFIACVLGPRSPVIRVDDPALDLLLPDRAPEADAAVAVDRVVSVPQIFGELATDRAFRDVVTRHAAALWTADPRLVLQPRDDRGWST